MYGNCSNTMRRLSKVWLVFVAGVICMDRAREYGVIYNKYENEIWLTRLAHDQNMVVSRFLIRFLPFARIQRK